MRFLCGAVAVVFVVTACGSSNARGGGSVRVTVEASGTALSPDAMAGAASIIRSRLAADSLEPGAPEVSGAEITFHLSSDPGGTTLDDLLAPGRLEFRAVEVDATGQPEIYPPDSVAPVPSVAPSSSFPAVTVPPLTPPDQVIDQAPAVFAGRDDKGVPRRYVVGPVLVGGDVIKSAKASEDQMTGGGWAVELTFTAEGGTEFDQKIAARYYQRQIAIIVDKAVITAPSINAQSFGGQATISGGDNGFTEQQAQTLADLLAYGALPEPFHVAKIATR